MVPYQSGALVYSATQILAFQMWKLGFIKTSHFSFMEAGHYCLAALCYLEQIYGGDFANICGL